MSERGQRSATNSTKFCGDGPRISTTALERRRTGQSTTMFIKGCWTSFDGAVRCSREAPTAFPTKWFTASLASYAFVVCILGHFRELAVKSVRKPDAGDRHVRFDERGRETGRLRSVPALVLDSTPLIPNTHVNGELAVARQCAYSRA